jgi:hypothetical protein
MPDQYAILEEEVKAIEDRHLRRYDREDQVLEYFSNLSDRYKERFEVRFYGGMKDFRCLTLLLQHDRVCDQWNNDTSSARLHEYVTFTAIQITI